jgi:hypothetical protein
MGDGDVDGPASSTDNAVARFDGTTGKLIQNSLVTVSDTGAVAGVTTLAASGAVTLSGGTANGVAYLNGSKVLTTGSALTFDGTNFVLGTGGTSGSFQFTQRVASSASPVSAFRVTNGVNATFDVTLQTSLASIGSGVGDLAFLNTGSEKMRLTSTGLGIGTSSPIASQLHVYTNTDNAYAARFEQDHPTGWGVLIDTDATATNDPALWVKNATDTILWAGSSGNVGIGTSLPTTKLDVVGIAQISGNFFAGFGNTTANISASSSVANGGAGFSQFLFGNASSGSRGYFTYSHANDSLIIGTAGTTKATLDSSGNLLVGTTTNTNSSRLVVNGTISETVGGVQYQVVSQTDIGTAPNEIPLNQYLGKLAYEDVVGLSATLNPAPTLASAATIQPLAPINFVSGITTINTITVPAEFVGGGQITLIPTGIFLTGTSGNIAVATTSVVSRALIMTYDATTAKWYPSY